MNATSRFFFIAKKNLEVAFIQNIMVALYVQPERSLIEASFCDLC